MGAIIAFWFAALVVAALAFPFTARYLRRFPDAGAGLALAMGLLLVGHGYFLLRVLRVLPEGRGGFIVAVALFALCSVALTARDRRFVSTMHRSLPGIIISVCLFTVAFFALLLILPGKYIEKDLKSETKDDEVMAKARSILSLVDVIQKVEKGEELSVKNAVMALLYAS